MAKSNPIGVRFDLDALKLIKKEQKLKSPQQVLNWLMDNYGATKTWLSRMAQIEEAINNQPETITTTASSAIVVFAPPKEVYNTGKKIITDDEPKQLSEKPVFKNEVEEMVWEAERKLKNKIKRK